MSFLLSHFMFYCFLCPSYVVFVGLSQICQVYLKCIPFTQLVSTFEFSP